MADKEMSFLEHIAEFRKRLIVVLIVLSIAALFCYFFFNQLLKIILLPLGNEKLIYLSLMEPFLARFKLSLWTAFLFTFPVITYEALAFVSPALKRREKKYIYLSMTLIIILFTAGAVFGYFLVLPIAIKWLAAQGGKYLKPNLTAENYVSFSVFFLIAFGACFQTPLVVWLLAKLKVVTPRQLLKSWRIALIIILITAAIITPDWSPITMLFVAVPMVILYGLGIILAKWF